MKNISALFIGVLLFLLLTGCSKENDALIDESVLSELPSFEYLGYIYYVHPHLGIRERFYYDQIKDEVRALDSYRFRSWFIPSLHELEHAANAGFIPKIPYLIYVSSSMEGIDSNLHYLYLTYEIGWISDAIPYYDHSIGDFTVYPMIKFRK